MQIVSSNGSVASNVIIHAVDADRNPIALTGAGDAAYTIKQNSAYNLTFYNVGFDHEGYTVSRFYTVDGDEEIPFVFFGLRNDGQWVFRGGRSYGWEYFSKPTSQEENGDLHVYMELRRIVSSLENNPVHTNVRMTLYDYGSYINVGRNKDLLFGHYTRVYEGIDGQPVYRNHTNGYGKRLNGGKPYVLPTLVDGVPKTKSGVSYDYLFRTEGDALYTGEAPVPLSDYSAMRQETAFTAVGGYVSPYESMRINVTGDGGLFYEDEDGYLVYDSSEAAAYFNMQTGRFELSEKLIGPSHETFERVKGSLPYFMNFLPFDKAGASSTLLDIPGAPAKKVYRLPYSTTEGLQSTIANMWFGMCIEFDFYMPQDGEINGRDMIFEFGGDDDVWCYVDDVLVLDIGGVHSATYGSINFSSGLVLDPNISGNHSSQTRTLRKTFETAGASTAAFDGDTFADYTKHHVKFFYLERGGNISYCRLRFNVPLLPEKSLTVRKQLEPHENSEITHLVKDALNYEFRVLAADAEGNATETLFIKPGTSFDVLVNGQVVRQEKVDADGVFRLKADESAQFHGIWALADAAGVTSYVVEERLPTAHVNSYGAVEYVVDGSTNTVTGEDGGQSSFTTYRTVALDPHQAQLVVYRNKVMTTVPVTITKREDGVDALKRQEVYRIQLLTGNAGDPQNALKPLAAGSVYTVNGEERKLAEDGVIELRANETATIRFISGTQFIVRELEDDAYSYTSSYLLDGGSLRTPYALGTIAANQNRASEVVVVNTYFDPATPPQTSDSLPLVWLALLAGVALLCSRRLRRA